MSRHLGSAGLRRLPGTAPRVTGLLAFLALGLPGCDAYAGGVDAAPDTAQVVIGGRATQEHLVPPRVRVAEGGVVEFRTVDGRVHTVEFLPDSLSPEAHAFLETSGQLRSPPLVDRGTVYAVSFAGAPPGYYPFFVQGPGEAARGAVFVE